MKKLCIGIIAALAFIVLVNYANAQMVSYAGKWKTTGTTFQSIIDFEMRGNEVVGTYMNGQGRIAGTLDLNGRTMRGTWSETTTEGVVLGSGDIFLTLSGDGNSIDGTIWTGPQAGVGSPFTAVRIE